MTCDTRRQQQQNKATLFRECPSDAFLAIALLNERQKRCNVIDEMCNRNASMDVVSYYTTVTMKLCDGELRSRPIFDEQSPDPAGLTFGDSRTFFGFAKLFASRERQILNKMTELDDEQNRYGSLTKPQEEMQDILCQSLVRVQKFTQNEQQQHSAPSLEDFDKLFSDDSVRDFLQTVFFLLLTHSHTLREVVCSKKNENRLKTHDGFLAKSSSIVNFFECLTVLTQQYIAFKFGERQYLDKIFSLYRTGAVFEQDNKTATMTTTTQTE